MSQGASCLHRFVSKAFGTDWITLPTSAVIYSPFAGLSFCQNWTCLLWTVPKLVVYFLWGGLAHCALWDPAEWEHVLSNCKALKVTMFVIWEMGYGASFISALNCKLWCSVQFFQHHKQYRFPAILTFHYFKVYGSWSLWHSASLCSWNCSTVVKCRVWNLSF